MEYEGCYSSAVELIKEASQQFGDKYTLNKAKYDSLTNICEAVDNLVGQIDCKSVDVSVDEITKQFTIEIVCDEVIFEYGRSNEFFTLIQWLSSFSFSKRGKDLLQITLNINDMWERASGYKET